MEENNQNVGQPVNQNVNVGGNSNTTENTTNGYAITSLVLGCVGLVGWVVAIIGYIVGALAIVFGCISKKSRKSSMSTVGIVMGSITLVLSLLNSIAGIFLALAVMPY